MKNIIVLTHGISGSSLYASLLAQAGYWLGDATMKKTSYDTFENVQFIELNNQLLARLGPTLEHTRRFDPRDVSEITRQASDQDYQPLRDFVAAIKPHQPWLWKDPRLTWTIRTWENALALEDVAFLVLTREPMQAWISSILGRHINTYRHVCDYNEGITRSNLEFLHSRGLPHLALSFEDLLLRPEQTLSTLNAFFGLDLRMEHLRKVCNIPLYRKSHGWKAWILALLIFGKNFRERDGRRRGVDTPAQRGVA